MAMRLRLRRRRNIGQPTADHSRQRTEGPHAYVNLIPCKRCPTTKTWIWVPYSQCVTRSALSESSDDAQCVKDEPRPPSPSPSFDLYHRETESRTGDWSSVEIRLVGSHPLWGHYLYIFTMRLESHWQLIDPMCKVERRQSICDVSRRSPRTISESKRDRTWRGWWVARDCHCSQWSEHSVSTSFGYSCCR